MTCGFNTQFFPFMTLGQKLEEFLPIPQSEVKNVRGWLEAVRDFCYRTLMHACMSAGDEFYVVVGLQQQLMSSVFTQLQPMENRHLRLFLRMYTYAHMHNRTHTKHTSVPATYFTCWGACSSS